MGKRLIGSVGLKSGTDTGFDLDEKGQIHGYSDTQFALPVGDDNQVLTSLASEASGLKWATLSTGDVDLTYIGQVVLGSANQNIGLSSGLDDYEWIMCFFHLRKSGGTNFTPEMQVYQGGSLTTGGS